MKNLICFLLLLPIAAFAQNSSLKINASSLALKNFSFQYEHSIGKKTSLALGFRFMPKSGLPFQSSAEDIFNLDEEDVNIGRFKTGNIAITPEFRYYFGKDGHSGFYLAPYARYANFDIKLPVKYQSNSTQREADFTGNIHSYSGGLMIGTQYNLGKSIVLDIWIIGGHYGGSSGNLTSVITPALTPTEQSSLRETLGDFDPTPFKYSYTLNANGAEIKATGPWAGIRGAGLNIGIRF